MAAKVIFLQPNLILSSLEPSKASQCPQDIVLGGFIIWLLLLTIPEQNLTYPPGTT